MSFWNAFWNLLRIALKVVFNSWDYPFKEAREEEVNRSKEMHSDVYEDTILVEVEEDRSDHW